MLPAVPARTEEIDVSGTQVTVRSLTVSEVRRIQGCDADAADALAVSLAVGCTVEEAGAWLATVPADVAFRVMSAVFRLSGLDEGATKSG